MERYERALERVVADLKQEFGDKLLGLLLAGSYAYGEMMATSDIDMFVVVDEPWRQKRTFVVDGVEVELFVNPEHKIAEEIAQAESTTDMFARGRSIYDPKNVVADLQQQAQSIASQLRPIPLGDDLYRLRYMVTDTLKDAYDLVERGDRGVDLALHNALQWTLDAYYKLSGRRIPKPKYVMHDLQKREPALADVVDVIVSGAEPPRFRWERLDALADEVLQHVGGKVVRGETSRQRVEPVAVVAHIEGIELPSEDIVVPPAERHRHPAAIAVYAVVGLGLFVIALSLMRHGAVALVPALRGSVFTDNAWSTLGFGWLGACIVLSGSPVAASALTLFDGGSIDRSQSFTMLTGSRLGAAFVVLVAGAIYALRNRQGRGRRAPISIGILSLLVTMAIYVPGAAIGYVLLDSGSFDGLSVGTSPQIASLTDTLFGWAVDLASLALPGWSLFPLGVVVLMTGFWLIDRVMPSVGLERAEHRPEAWYDRKWPMFLLGCGVCLLTLSVSVALTVLVPLVAKGYLRRANTIPYIVGANIPTLADTLVAAILLGNLDAVRVVMSATLSVAALSLLVLAFAYPALRRGCLFVAQTVLRSPVRLAIFVGLLFAAPLALIAI